MKHKWTEEEKEIVRRDYDGTNQSACRIAFRLGVSFPSVKGKVQMMGLTKDHSRPWRDEEIEDLSQMINQYQPSVVARKLHRSINSILVKSKKLGLSRRVRDGWYNKKEVCEIFGVDHRWLQKRMDAGELKAKWNSEFKPQQNGGGYWRIQEEDLRDFIINHSPELQGRNVDLFQIIVILTTGI